MNWIAVLSRVAHVGTAIVLVGGSVFTLFVLLPSASKLSSESQKALSEGVAKYWKRFVHAGILFLIVSGLYNYMHSIPNHKGDGLYHALIGAKIILAFIIFFLATALVGKSSKLEGIRKDRKKWLSVVVLLGAIIVSISGFVKIRPPKGAAETSKTPAVSETTTHPGS